MNKIPAKEAIAKIIGSDRPSDIAEAKARFAKAARAQNPKLPYSRLKPFSFTSKGGIGTLDVSDLRVGYNQERDPHRHVLCAICKDPDKPLTDGEFQAEDVKHTRDGLVHADCYYEKIGEVVDAHPITSGRVGHCADN